MALNCAHCFRFVSEFLCPLAKGISSDCSPPLLAGSIEGQISRKLIHVLTKREEKASCSAHGSDNDYEGHEEEEEEIRHKADLVSLDLLHYIFLIKKSR